MSILDGLSVYINVSVLLFVCLNIFLTVGGLLGTLRQKKDTLPELTGAYPMVSVLVPAHNEGLVIRRTVQALLGFDYPEDRYEIIVINDNSSDDSARILTALQAEYPGRKLKIIHTDAQTGGRGKSHALNLAMEQAEGTVIAVYDADNTPEPDALGILVKHLMADENRAAVIGKFRTRNKKASLLTRFINIETLSHQCMNQVGRYFYFRLCTIPGTNYVIRRSVVEQIGGWDPKALAEDTEISFTVYRMGYYIACAPAAVTWEQEPQRLMQWFRQRTRWARGNIYVFFKNFPYIFDRNAGAMRLDILYYALTYGIMFTALACSDIIGILCLLGMVRLELGAVFGSIWLPVILIYVMNVLVSLWGDREEINWNNALLILLMLFTYSKMWTAVVIYALYQSAADKIRKKEAVWDKTSRVAEPEEHLPAAP